MFKNCVNILHAIDRWWTFSLAYFQLFFFNSFLSGVLFQITYIYFLCLQQIMHIAETKGRKHGLRVATLTTKSWLRH